jgi:hypothetical protein
MVSATLLRFLCAVRLFLLAIVLGITDRYYFTNAEMLCQRFSEGAETMPKILRLVSPRRFFRSRCESSLPRAVAELLLVTPGRAAESYIGAITAVTLI